MKKIRLILMVVMGALLVASAGGAAAWWGLRARAAHGAASTEAAAEAASAPAPVVDKRPQKYVSLDKVIVMLRRSDSDSSPHYLAMDLVLKTSDEQEKVTKEHLPMLRSVALRALADYTPEKAAKMSIDQFSEVINTAYTATYAHEQRDKPFSEAMIGKLIIE
jgi:flagellar protein FliL